MLNRRPAEIQRTALGKCLQARPVLYRSRPAGVAQSSHAFVGGTVSTWARWRIPVNKGRKGIRNADQALTVRGEHADRIVGSPSWLSSINYNRSIAWTSKTVADGLFSASASIQGNSLSRSKKTLSNYLCLLFPEIVYRHGQGQQFLYRLVASQVITEFVGHCGRNAPSVTWRICVERGGTWWSSLKELSSIRPVLEPF